MSTKANTSIKMSRAALRSRTEAYLADMKRAKDFSPLENVDMVRIWNTIESKHLAPTDEIFRDYAKLYVAEFLAESARKLEATVSKGMCFYSKKYDLYIGGKPHWNSEYTLED